MAYFAYTILEDIESGEISGVMDAPSLELATLLLVNKGYLVRDIRLATNHDMQIERFKKLRNKLAGQSDDDLDVAAWVHKTQKSKKSLSLRLLFAGLVILLVVIYLAMEKS